MIDRIPYHSFLWKFGTTSFRTVEFNYSIERQLQLLNDFWEIPENRDQGWEKKYMCRGQKDIYEIKDKYYDYLVSNNFMTSKGSDIKYKTAREKTSGLVDLGLINENHRLTDAGQYLLNLASTARYNEQTEFGISQDSYLYLKQLLKLHVSISGYIVRPFIVILYLLSRLDYLSYEEFKYIIPFCINIDYTESLIHEIERYRNQRISVDEIIINTFMSYPNYREGYHRLMNSQEVTEDLILSISMNRKSPLYDKPYYNLYRELYNVYCLGDSNHIITLYEVIRSFKNGAITTKWLNLLFDTSSRTTILRSPNSHIINILEDTDEKKLKKWFFFHMHLIKTKCTLEDYFDLNKRYLNLSNIFLFEEGIIKLDIIPKQFFASAIESLYVDAYCKCDNLQVNCSITDICSDLVFNEDSIVRGISEDLQVPISNITSAYTEVDRIKYDRFRRFVDSHFTKDVLVSLLNDFKDRKDSNINRLVTDNADIPTIFEYILGIIWYKISDYKGKVLDFMKLSIGADFLPITHASGGEADIVYEYERTSYYPEHSLLLEATLTESTTQRRAEMEPVSRHLGNHILRTRNYDSYCVFVSTYLNINVISDFRGRKELIYCDPQNVDDCIDGMKIIPIDVDDLLQIIESDMTYDTLYAHFDAAYRSTERRPNQWYSNNVKINSNSHS